MDELLSRLEQLLDRMEDVGRLDTPTLERVQQEWEEAVAALAATPGGAVSPRQVERLELLIQRIPVVQGRIAQHRSQMAQLMMMENRRLQQLRKELGEVGERIASERRA